jgi:hypothetical protein
MAESRLKRDFSSESEKVRGREERAETMSGSGPQISHASIRACQKTHTMFVCLVNTARAPGKEEVVLVKLNNESGRG